MKRSTMFVAALALGALPARAEAPQGPAARNNLGLRFVMPTDPVYGGHCDGQHDDTSAIQAAANAGGWVMIPPGCRISSTIALTGSGVHLVGYDVDTTTILSSNSSTDVFAFTGDCFDCSIERLRIISTAQSPTAGCVIDSTHGTADSRVKDVRIEKGWSGICMTNAPVRGVLSVENVDMYGMSNDDFMIDGASQFFLTNSTAGAAGGAGVHIVSAGGFYLSNVTIGQATSALLIDPEAGKKVFDGLVVNFEADLSRGQSAAGVQIDSTKGGKIWGLRLTNIRSGFGSGAGFALRGPNTNNVNIDNFTAERNRKEGVVVAGGQYITISNGQVIGNSAVAAEAAGIVVAGGSHIDIHHNMVNFLYPDQANSNQAHALVIQNTFDGILSVTDNDFSGGHVSAPVVNDSASPSIRLERNIGYNPVGVRYPKLGASPWTFTNGPTTALAVLTGGVCSGLKVGDASVPSAFPLSLLLAPGQKLTGACTANPKFSLMVQ